MGQGMNFRSWLSRQKARADSVGDVARGAAMESEWRGNSPGSLRVAMVQRGASRRALEAFELSEIEWKKAREHGRVQD